MAVVTGGRRAVILAGGKGTRLRPYTVVLPKPLMPVGDHPILEIIVRQLARTGFGHLTFAVNHQAELMQAFFGDGGKWGVRIDYSLEDQPLGTMGPLRLIRDLPDDFLVMNGDVLTDLDYGLLYEQHVQQRNLFTISSHVRKNRVNYGVLDVDAERQLRGFNEKPSYTYEVSMGVYVLKRDVLKFVPSGTAYGFDTLMHDLIAARQRVAVRRFEGHWLDIGSPDDYAEAVAIFEENPQIFVGTKE
jgi:NDP-sugar pyrophosphorylase family protein